MKIGSLHSRIGLWAIVLTLGAFAQTYGAAVKPGASVLPLPTVHILPNGLSVAVIERHSVPMLTVEVVIESGGESDPRGLPGEASFVASMLPQGTATMGALQISQSLDQVGASLSTGAEWDRSYAGVSILSNHAARAFKILADIVRKPAFPRRQFLTMQRRLVSALEVEQGDASYIADESLRVRLFAGTPYGHPLDGTRASLLHLSPADLAAFHHTYYRPSNAFILVVGDISPARAFALALSRFGGWKALPPPPRPSPNAAKIAIAHSIIVIDDPAAAQTEIRVGIPAVPRASPRYDDLAVANQVLGGPSENRLFHALRSRRGLVYGASSQLECYRSEGAWVASTQTKPASSAEAFRVMLDQIHNLGEAGIRASEENMALDYLIGHQALEFESFPGMARRYLGLMVYDLPLDHWRDFPAQLRAIDLGQMNRIVQQTLDADDESMILVGNAAQFARKLKTLGQVRVVPLDRLDLASPSLERPAKSAKSSAQNPATVVEPSVNPSVVHSPK